MILLRSLVFSLSFYTWSGGLSIGMIPFLLGPPRLVEAGMRFWARGVIWLLRVVCGIHVEFRGLENLPSGPVLVAAKHQCMFDTMGPLVVIDDACYVMKRELTKIPVYGWISRKTRMIVVDREGEASAMRGLLTDAKARAAENRRIIIFPEGSRTARLSARRRGPVPNSRVTLRAAGDELRGPLAGAWFSTRARRHRLRISTGDPSRYGPPNLHERARGPN